MDLRGVEKLCAQDLYLKMFLELQKSLKESLGIWNQALKGKNGFQYSFVDWEVYRVVVAIMPYVDCLFLKAIACGVTSHSHTSKKPQKIKKNEYFPLYLCILILAFDFAISK